MLKQFKTYIGKKLAGEYIRTLEVAAKQAKKEAEEMELSTNRRVAEIIAKMDPFEPLMREFHGVFTQDFENPEERMDARSALGFKMWAYQQSTDPNFKYMIEWIMNTFGNETIKRAPVTTDRVLYGRAQISSMILLRKEVGRLSSLYEDELEKNKVQDFDEHSSVDL